jgi:hypothetical protein
MNNICVNTLISDLETGAQYIVLWIAPQDGYGFWYNLSSRSQKPVRFNMSDIAVGDADGRFEITTYFPSDRTYDTSKTQSIGEVYFRKEKTQTIVRHMILSFLKRKQETMASFTG